MILDSANFSKTKKMIWFHSSSLGEFEQAKPIIERLKTRKRCKCSDHFFSPSGYENSKKYPYADLISYIPFDTKSNAEKFIAITNPTLAVIMRYDVWPNMISSLKAKNIPIYLVDATLQK
ncbi:MAG: hypothetical protein MZV64_02900 [Ignavibacteriales bacterium]|nr:hypothetical protein [Ignavibacteriales bacterium]